MAQEAVITAVPLSFITFNDRSLPDALSPADHHPGFQPTTQTLYDSKQDTLSVQCDIQFYGILPLFPASCQVFPGKCRKNMIVDFCILFHFLCIICNIKKFLRY